MPLSILTGIIRVSSTEDNHSNESIKTLPKVVIIHSDTNSYLGLDSKALDNLERLPVTNSGREGYEIIPQIKDRLKGGGVCILDVYGDYLDRFGGLKILDQLVSVSDKVLFVVHTVVWKDHKGYKNELLEKSFESGIDLVFHRGIEDFIYRSNNYDFDEIVQQYISLHNEGTSFSKKQLPFFSIAKKSNIEDRIWINPKLIQPSTSHLFDLRFLIKRALWHATEEEKDDIYGVKEEDIFGIKSEYELSHQEGKLTLTRAVEEEMSDFLPQKLSLNQSSDGYVSELSLTFPTVGVAQTFSFPRGETWEAWTPLDTKAPSALRLLYEQVKAYNLAWKHVFETRDGESQINQIRTAIVTLGDPGKKAFMQAIYAHVMRKMLAHSTSTPLKDMEEEVTNLSHPFILDGIPKLISIEYGEIEEIDEEQDEATVLLKTWIHPLKESRRTVFSLSRLRDIGRKAEEGVFLYTTFMREIQEYGAELEYGDPELAKLSFV